MELINEKRVFERFPARFPVKFKHSAGEFGTDVFMRDASALGVKVTTKDRLFLNDAVSLLIKLPDNQQPLILNGEVVWTKNKEPQWWDVGLRLHKVNFMEMQRIFRLVSDQP